MSQKIRTPSFDLWPDDHSLRYVNKHVRPQRVRTRGAVRWEGIANACAAALRSLARRFDGDRP